MFICTETTLSNWRQAVQWILTPTTSVLRTNVVLFCEHFMALTILLLH